MLIIIVKSNRIKGKNIVRNVNTHTISFGPTFLTAVPHLGDLNAHKKQNLN